MNANIFLKRIKEYTKKFFQVLPNAEYVRIETMQESVFVPANSGFPALVLAMKDCLWQYPVYIIYKEESTADGGSIDSYSAYKLFPDGFARRTERNSSYRIYGEREIS